MLTNVAFRLHMLVRSAISPSVLGATAAVFNRNGRVLLARHSYAPGWHLPSGGVKNGEHPDTAQLVTGDVVAQVRALKDEPGDELQVWGSGDLLRTLLQHDLVDRFRLMTFPVVLGSGHRLFGGGELPATMRPVDVGATERGTVIATYEPAGPVRHGAM